MAGTRTNFILCAMLVCIAAGLFAGVGDPQLKTDHTWYKGELSCSDFTRLFATQDALYQSKTGNAVDTDEEKAIVSWYWRNLVFYHTLSPVENYWDLTAAALRVEADGESVESVVRDYWTGLFSYGFAPCGTTHAQFTAEMEYRLGHCRGRVVGVARHNSHEAFLTGGAYGAGKWVLLDHDESGIVYNNPASPDYLLNIAEIVYSTYTPATAGRVARTNAARETILDNEGAPTANGGWFISGGYFPNANTDATSSDLYGTLADVNQVEPLSGYAGAPPVVSLRKGEKFRRYLKPGLGATTYAFWGPNNTDGSPGPDNDRTWVNQPQNMYQASAHNGYHPAQGEYGNGLYTYTPNFSDTSYQEGVISESGSQVTFFFYSPYVVSGTPSVTPMWSVIDQSCTNGLVLTASSAGVTVDVSTDSGTSWQSGGTLNSTLDITNLAKGHHSYLLRFNAGPSTLAGKNIVINTAVQCNDRVIPHLKDSGSQITYQASGKAVFAAGPN
ncbi:MAG: hypothetical protein ABIF71_15955 [Planctomycetota bacterium]